MPTALLPTPATVRLRDGSQVVISPIDAGDRQALNAGFERMGRESTVPALPDRDAGALGGATALPDRGRPTPSRRARRRGRVEYRRRRALRA